MRYIFNLLAGLLAATLLSTGVYAQTCQVNGCVLDSNGNPLTGATVATQNGSQSVEVGADGRFTMNVAIYDKSVVASKESYFSQEAEVDGSFLIFKLKYNKKYSEEKAKTEEAKRLAEEQAKVAAAEQAIAKAKAEEQARIAAEKVEQTRILAEQRATKRQKTKELNDAYGEKFKNRGLINSVELSYNYQIASGDVIYLNSGHYKYGSLHPVEIDYLIGYRFNHIVSLSAGVGFTYNHYDLTAFDQFDNALYPAHTYYKSNIPVFLNAKVYFMRSKVQSLISLSGGVYAATKTVMVEGGVGCAVRVSKKCNLNIMATVKTSPWPSYQGRKYGGYKPVFAPGVKIGFTM